MSAVTASAQGLRVLVVDDEALARTRLLSLLADCRNPQAIAPAQAAHAVQAMELLQHQGFDVLLLDVQMPGVNGLALAQTLSSLPAPPVVIFVTAHAEHAVQAFELDAADYLTKPVRLERLQSALQKAERLLQSRSAHANTQATQEVLLIQERNRSQRVPLADVLYFKAELKYVTVRTAQRSFILDGTLNELEDKYPSRFLRIHRNALVAKHLLRALEKQHDPQDGEAWAVRLDGVEELLLVSRRQLAAVREVLGRG